MNLLIITQAIDKDDENLGAFYYWWKKMAQETDKIIVIAGRKGTADLGKHAEIYTFGKDKGFGRARRIWTFWELFSRHYARSDAVLFHQIPEFVIAAAPFLLSLDRMTALWYAHGAVPTTLRVAERLVDYVFTSSPEGFRLPSKKVIYLGQAINTDVFQPPAKSEHDVTPLRLVTVGRISPVKNYEVLLQACAAGKSKWDFPWKLSIYGGPLRPGDDVYLDLLKRLVREQELSAYVTFEGSRPYSEIPEILQRHDVFVNLSSTGSLDKAVFEAMACGLTVLTSNDAYRSILPPAYFIERPNPDYIADRIRVLSVEPRPNEQLRSIVVSHHGLDATVGSMIRMLDGEGFRIPKRAGAPIKRRHVA